MRERPDLPRARDSIDEVVARLVDDVLDALRLEHADVREEHHAEARVPQHLYAKNAHKMGQEGERWTGLNFGVLLGETLYLLWLRAPDR